MAEHWWKDAFIYGIDVERFCDSNGDGIGDFPGLTSKIGYLAELGVTCIWLLPFYPSSGRDNGYDITDFMQVDRQYGSFEDFLAFVAAAGEQGIRIIIDLVANHTSDQHPWFLSARYDPRSPFRDYYVWSDHPPPPPPGRGSIFPGPENSVWTFDEVARSYYHHRFYRFQPTLNYENPAVWKEMERVMDYWMSFGISGFRIDAAAHLIERPLDREGATDQNHTVLRDIYTHVTRRIPDALLLGEVDEEEGELARFFDGEQLNMMFNFFLNNYLLHGLATCRATSLQDALERLPPPPLNGHWANFLRNLDEADLERLTPDQMDEVMQAFAPKEEMRIFGRGIRRRLAPMLGGDIRRLKLAFSLLFSMPGAPVICYGDEIGMGEDLAAPGRNAVRCPMQWSAGRSGGFSTAPKAKLAHSVIDAGPQAYREINVEEQRGREDSLLSFVQRLAKVRRSVPALGRQNWQVLHGAPDSVLAHGYSSQTSELILLHNLAPEPAQVAVRVGGTCQGPAEALIGEPAEARAGELRLKIEGYGYHWLRWGR